MSTIIALILCVLFLLKHKSCENLAKKLSELKNDYKQLEKRENEATTMRNNVEIIKFADGKHYAVVNLYHALKMYMCMGCKKERPQYHEYQLVYDESMPTQKSVASIANGYNMLIFPIPEGRENDYSFIVRALWKDEHNGNECTFIDGDFFMWNRPMEIVISINPEKGTISMSKKTADQLGYVERDGHLIKP